MILHQGYAWPDDVEDRWKHSLMHVRSVEVGINRCRSRRSAIQAGGNVGLWPARLAQVFERVFTFEPDGIARACMEYNISLAQHGASKVVVSPAALGRADGRCGWRHKDLGSHRVVEEGDSVSVTTIDSLGLQDLDFLQLDIEGYEAHALEGGSLTIQRCHPVIQVELRNLSARYGSSDAAIRSWLTAQGYHEVDRAQGSDFIFVWRPV